MKKLSNIIYKRYSFVTQALLSCFCFSIIYLMFCLDVYMNEPIAKRIMACIAIALITVCKMALCVHLAVVLTIICCKSVPKYCRIPSYKEMQIISALIAFSIMLFYLLGVCYQEDFYIGSLYVGIKYLFIVALTILHTKLRKG